MSYHEALEDGIPMTKTQKGVCYYHPPCHICDTPTSSWNYIRGQQYCCPECREIMVRQHREQQGDGNPDKRKKKLATAIKRISKVADIRKYEGAIALVERNLYKQGWFQSTEEIMVAIELLKCGVKINHQVKIFDYSVDFVLPDYKVLLEIDGKIYHGKETANAQQMRDSVITDRFGPGWEMIHITTDNINENVTRLMEAINTVLYKRKFKRG